MKYAGGEAFERMGISRSSSWPIVTMTGAGAAGAACGGGTGDGRRAGLLAASAFRERNITRLARVNVFTRDAPERRITSYTKPLVYAYVQAISNTRSRKLPLRPLQGCACIVRCVRTPGSGHKPGIYSK